MLTQLKLLKILQEDLNSRFGTLTTGPEGAREPIDRELAEIAAEQGKLAQLAWKLAEPPQDNPEDNLDKLPDVRENSPPGDPVSPPERSLEPIGKERN
jgi:hypothetical protein